MWWLGCGEVRRVGEEREGVFADEREEEGANGGRLVFLYRGGFGCPENFGLTAGRLITDKHKPTHGRVWEHNGLPCSARRIGGPGVPPFP